MAGYNDKHLFGYQKVGFTLKNQRNGSETHKVWYVKGNLKNIDGKFFTTSTGFGSIVNIMSVCGFGMGSWSNGSAKFLAPKRLFDAIRSLFIDGYVDGNELSIYYDYSGADPESDSPLDHHSFNYWKFYYGEANVRKGKPVKDCVLIWNQTMRVECSMAYASYSYDSKKIEDCSISSGVISKSLFENIEYDDTYIVLSKCSASNVACYDDPTSDGNLATKRYVDAKIAEAISTLNTNQTE